ncbi:MAG TPA: AAA family ATPase [Kofleriaceae bacterium]|jgi:5-methylcytosine-specific restriction protein B
MKGIVALAYTPRDQWEAIARTAFSEDLGQRYVRVKDLTEKRNDERRFQLRVNADAKEGALPFAALLPPDQDLSGRYGGMSFVMFPADKPGDPAILSMGVGSSGLAPDEAILGRPGHGRKCAAIAAWLNSRLPGAAWAKRDPVRIDLGLPRSLTDRLQPWQNALRDYGALLYATFVPPTERTAETDAVVADAITAFVDLFFDERRIAIKKDFQQDAERIRRAWMSRVLPGTTDQAVCDLLEQRRFVIVEGPPGTGKTELTSRVLADRYAGRGEVIQFHPGTTYESFIGGLAPHDGGALGFTFRPVRGHLMNAALAAAANPTQPYLLVIDEINRADLSKVLGEAIYLFEPDKPDREITLAHEFERVGRKLKLPANLHVLGTMNSADRSIAILDVAVRRRFAFVPLWPQTSVVEAHAGPILQRSFHELLMLFVEHASDDALPLTLGHAYFLGGDNVAHTRLATSVRPLLEEYLAQGYVAGFADEVRAYIDRIAQV